MNCVGQFHSLARLFIPCLLALALSGIRVEAQTPDEAKMFLDSASRALNDRNYPFATQRYREYLQRFGGNKDANLARYGLGIALLEGSGREYQQSLEQLNPLASVKDFSELPFVYYYQAICNRGLGNRALATAEARPGEANFQKDLARQRFEEASRQLASAITSLGALKDNPKATEILGRATCDLAEMQLRIGKTKEALATINTFLENKAFAQSPAR